MSKIGSLAFSLAGLCLTAHASVLTRSKHLQGATELVPCDKLKCAAQTSAAGQAPVKVAHVPGLCDILLCVSGLSDLLLCQPLLILLQLLLVGSCHKSVLVPKQMVLSLALFQEPACFEKL